MILQPCIKHQFRFIWLACFSVFSKLKLVVATLFMALRRSDGWAGFIYLCIHVVFIWDMYIHNILSDLHTNMRAITKLLGANNCKGSLYVAAL